METKAVKKEGDREGAEVCLVTDTVSFPTLIQYCPKKTFLSLLPVDARISPYHTPLLSSTPVLRSV